MSTPESRGGSSSYQTSPYTAARPLMRIIQALSITKPCVELLQGRAAAPGGKILEQHLQVLVQALDFRRVLESRAAAGHELRGMQHEFQMGHSFSARCARHLQHCVEVRLLQKRGRAQPAELRRNSMGGLA